MNLLGLALLASTALVVSSETPSTTATATLARPSRLWAVRFEDYVHPALRAQARAAAEASGGRWGAIDLNRRAWFRADSRASLFAVLKENGFRSNTGESAPWTRS